MYALMLLLGILALYVIISYLPKWYNYVFLIFIFINIFFTFSKAAFGIALITFIVHFIFRMIVTFKKNKIRNFIYLGLVGILGISGILLIPFPFFMEIQLFNEARRFILEYYVTLGIGSYDGRTEIWDNVLALSKGNYFLYGRGLILFGRTLYFYNEQVNVIGGTAFSHNGFLEILGQWGLVGLIPYCLGTLTIFVIDIYVAIKNYKIGVPALIIFMAFLGYTMVETSTLFDLTIEGVTTTALVTLPALSWLSAKRHPEVNREIVNSAEEIEYRMSTFNRKRFLRQTSLYTALFLSLVSLFALYYFRQTNAVISLYAMFIALVVVIFITLPRVLGNIYQLRIEKRKGVFWLLFFLIIFLNLCSLFVIVVSAFPVVFLVTTKITLITLLITEKFINKEKVSFMSYLIKVIGRASVFLLAFVIAGYLVIFLYRGLTWFILGEIILLFILFTIPFICEANLETGKLNNRMLIVFARGIGK